jgi:glutamate 5-kinase
MARIVIKLGTSTLTSGTPHLALPRLADLARQVAFLRSEGHEVVLVSSGAMAAGSEMLGFPRLPRAIPAKQMLSAVGQPRLMDVWGRMFGIYSIAVAQVLLTRDDLRARTRYLNARNALWALLQQGVLPVINENDTVATEEIRVGDNDNLSALVANLIAADDLYMLTDQDGLLTADPRKHTHANLVQLVDSPDIPQEIWQAAGAGGKMGVGGMQTKLQAADLARRSGVRVVIARGDQPEVLVRLAAGEMIGTQFTPLGSSLESFKRYLLAGGQQGRLVLDEGAVAAISAGGSLLPAGLRQVEGDFERGGTVLLVGLEGKQAARGLANYAGRDCAALCGLQSAQIEGALGFYYGDEIVHRDNMVLL